MIKNPALLFLLALLPACEMYAESHMTDNRVQVRQEKFTEEIPTSTLTNDYVAGIADNYTKSGSGPVELVVTYDPQSRTNTAMRAGDEVARIATVLHHEGVKDVATSIMPVREQGHESTALVSFSAYRAEGPAGCDTMMQGFESRVLEPDPDYKLGCTEETLFARQIANPSDLLGDAQPPTYRDARPASNIVDLNRTGAQNKPLKTEATQ